jgi:deoxyuridine 5'-triphosphate nucleotidohydrolase
MELVVRRLSPNATLPARGSAGAAGYDIASAEATIVPAGARHLVSTGLSIALPAGVYGRVAPRSGLASKRSVDVGAGVVDQDYRGEVKVLLVNNGDGDLMVAVGDRIAQLILEKIEIADVVEVDELDATERGAGGFGSTGK